MCGITVLLVEASIGSCLCKEGLGRPPECPQPPSLQQKHWFIDLSADLAGAEAQINPKEEPSHLRAVALRLSSAKYLLQQMGMVCLGIPRHLDNTRQKL